MTRAIIFANGFLPAPESARRLIKPGDILIAADGGAHHALSLGLIPQIILGDFDSLHADARQVAEKAGTRFLHYPCDKDETDLELALQYALEQDCLVIIILAALGGRIDQTLGNLSLLTNQKFSLVDIRLDDGVEEVFFVRTQAQVQGRAGDVISLIPWGNQVTGVSTKGLRWLLRGETLHPDKTRGISNEMLDETASVSIISGLLLLVHHRQP